jgi:parallel beta-helix repeat protein
MGYQTIEVQRNCCIIDGQGYRLETGSFGIELNGEGYDVHNVEIRDINITNCDYGIYINRAWNNTVSRNHISDIVYYGICLELAHFNNISGNNLIGNHIDLTGSSFCTISGNNITGSYHTEGIYVNDGCNNTISENIITGDFGAAWHGIYFRFDCCNNTISDNQITQNSKEGIRIESRCHNNTICNNNITANGAGIYFLTNCDHNTVYKNNITDNTNNGIYSDASDNQTIVRNKICFNGEYGIYMYLVFSSIICENDIINNSYGMALVNFCYDNLIYHNNFINNTNFQADTSQSLDFWDFDYPYGGNYWGDYQDKYPAAQEIDDSGLWDTPYTLDSNNQDNYPLMEPWTPPNLRLLNITSSKRIVGVTLSLDVYVSIVNERSLIENYSLTLHANTTGHSQTLTQNITMTSRESTIITFNLNTTGFIKGNYTLTAQTEPLPSETNLTDNLAQHWILTAMIGDITGADEWPDGKCDMRDIGLIARKFGIQYPDPFYDPNCDIIYDLRIDMRDIGTTARHFGETDP